MAKFIEGIAKYGPRLIYGPTVTQREFTRRLADTTGQRHADIMRTTLELESVILFYNRQGRAVEIPGVGSLRPVLKVDGSLRMRYRPLREIIAQLRALDLYEGRILNRENIGLDPEGFKALWDAEFPDDPLELPRLQAA